MSPFPSPSPTFTKPTPLSLWPSIYIDKDVYKKEYQSRIQDNWFKNIYFLFIQMMSRLKGLQLVKLQDLNQ